MIFSLRYFILITYFFSVKKNEMGVFYLDESWPKIEECEQKKNLFSTLEYQIDPFHLFMSPENKGFM